MYKKVLNCPIISRREIAPNQIELIIESETLASEAQAGQFVHISVESPRHVLRRPISICDAYENKARIIFEIKGEGTRLLAKKSVGESLNLIGPLGNGFEKRGGKAFVIGGGIGVFPLLKLCRELETPEIFLGFRSRAQVALEEDFAAAGNLHVATDDSSYGYGGFAINQMMEQIDEADIIYACGPAVMLKAVQKAANERDIAAQISMEQRMGCGIGACIGCVIRTTDGYAKVCRRGPVFDAKEVVFE